MGEGKSEGGPGVDRGGGRGCQLGPGLSSGSLFLPRVSLGAAGDNVALRGAAGGGGTRRTERYPPGPLRGDQGAWGTREGEKREVCPRTGWGLPAVVPLPLPPEGAPQDGRCPAWWLTRASRGRWPAPITGAFGVPASPGGEPPCPQTPRALPWPCCVPPSHRQPHPSPAGGVFVPGGFLLPFIPRGTGDPGRLRVPAHISGCRGQAASLPSAPGTGIFPLSSLSTFLRPAVAGGWRRGARSAPGVQAQP